MESGPHPKRTKIYTRHGDAERPLSMLEIGDMCHVAPRTAMQWFDKGQLSGFRIPGSRVRRVFQDSFRAFAKKMGTTLPDELIAPGVIVEKHSRDTDVNGQRVLSTFALGALMVSGTLVDRITIVNREIGRTGWDLRMRIIRACKEHRLHQPKITIDNSDAPDEGQMSASLTNEKTKLPDAPSSPAA